MNISTTVCLSFEIELRIFASKQNSFSCYQTHFALQAQESAGSFSARDSMSVFKQRVGCYSNLRCMIQNCFQRTNKTNKTAGDLNKFREYGLWILSCYCIVFLDMT